MKTTKYNHKRKILLENKKNYYFPSSILDINGKFLGKLYVDLITMLAFLAIFIFLLFKRVSNLQVPTS